MTKEEKEILLKDLSSRLPYGVYIEHTTTGIKDKLTNIVFQHKYNNTYSIQDINAWIMFFGNEYVDATYFRPMLRPMASMTEEEKSELKEYLEAKEVDCNGFGYSEGGTLEDYILCIPYSICVDVVDWLNKNKFDYRGLIEKGLALEAPEEMYNIK